MGQNTQIGQSRFQQLLQEKARSRTGQKHRRRLRRAGYDASRLRAVLHYTQLRDVASVPVGRSPTEQTEAADLRTGRGTSYEIPSSSSREGFTA